jgi:cell fate (sporulation/competence/biofilm development) regulator YlbF (YheA/YmcA/DUF963 family)
VSVYDQARAMVKALRDSAESQQMRRLGAKVKSDSRLEQLLSDFRRSQWEVQSAQMQGGQPARPHVERLEQLTRAVQQEQVMHEYLMAEAAYGKMLMEVQRVLGEAFSPEVPGAVKLQQAPARAGR